MSQSLRGMAVASLALLMLAVAGPRAWAAGAFELVTAAEAQSAARAEAAAKPEVRTRSLLLPKTPAPAIRVVTPNAAGSTVPAPLRIELTFSPVPGTRIVPSSFRVLYGLLKIDLTERLRPHATITETGVLVEQAQVPDGQHRLLVQVADDQGNIAEQELRIRVGAPS